MTTNYISQNFEIIARRYGPSSVFSPEYSNAYEKVWLEATQLIRNFNYEYEDNKIQVTIIWPKETHLDLKSNYEDEIKIELKANATSNNGKKIHPHFLTDFIYHCLTQLFIILNLSAPGILCFYSTKIKFSEELLRNVKLSSTQWMGYIQVNKEYSWPGINIIPISKTLIWFKSLNLGLRQIARSRLEKSLFALFNYSYSNLISPTNLLWLVISLEAFYDIPKSSIIHTLKKRIYMFLGYPKSKSKAILREINKFYELRSSIIHGQFEFRLPDSHELFEQEVLDEVDLLLITEEFIMTIIISSIQKMILNQAIDITFKESYKFKHKI